jgi:CheY-like chemotaxis protein
LNHGAHNATAQDPTGHLEPFEANVPPRVRESLHTLRTLRETFFSESTFRAAALTNAAAALTKARTRIELHCPRMKTILLVEDDPAQSRVYSLVLKAAGYTVITADNGDSAVATLALTPVDLMICDMFLPGRDGYEVIDACRRLKPGLPILGMSGGAEGADARGLLSGARELGAMVTMTKPFSDGELINVVDEIFRRNQQQPPSQTPTPPPAPKEKERWSVLDLLRRPKGK